MRKDVEGRQARQERTRATRPRKQRKLPEGAQASQRVDVRPVRTPFDGRFLQGVKQLGAQPLTTERIVDPHQRDGEPVPVDEAGDSADETSVSVPGEDRHRLETVDLRGGQRMLRQTVAEDGQVFGLRRSLSRESPFNHRPLPGDCFVDVGDGDTLTVAADRNQDPPIAGAFEPVEPRPVSRQLLGEEEMHRDVRFLLRPAQRWESQDRAPTLLHQLTADGVARLPPSRDVLYYMVARPARCQGAVDGELKVGLEVLLEDVLELVAAAALTGLTDQPRPIDEDQVFEVGGQGGGGHCGRLLGPKAILVPSVLHTSLRYSRTMSATVAPSPAADAAGRWRHDGRHRRRRLPASTFRESSTS